MIAFHIPCTFPSFFFWSQMSGEMTRILTYSLWSDERLNECNFQYAAIVTRSLRWLFSLFSFKLTPFHSFETRYEWDGNTINCIKFLQRYWVIRNDILYITIVVATFYYWNMYDNRKLLWFNWFWRNQSTVTAKDIFFHTIKISIING